MTLYVIPDLVFGDSKIIFHCRTWNAHAFGIGWIYLYERAGGVGFQGTIYDTLELAQSAANDWYKAKMAEGLKVATVEELRQALAEAEMKEGDR